MHTKYNTSGRKNMYAKNLQLSKIEHEKCNYVLRALVWCDVTTHFVLEYRYKCVCVCGLRSCLV